MIWVGALALMIWLGLCATGFWLCLERDDRVQCAEPAEWPDVVAVVPVSYTHLTLPTNREV